jgi:hypothetical protein
MRQFSLTPTMMKPYPQNQAIRDKQKAVYNYRHSRTRRTSENAFGILCQYFRVFYSPITIAPEAADNLIVSSCILHNMLRGHSRVTGGTFLLIVYNFAAKFYVFFWEFLKFLYPNKSVPTALYL